jgi:hypothetical protein
MYLIDMSTLLLNLEPGYHKIHLGQDIIIFSPLRRPIYLSVNPKLGTFPLGHVCMSSVVMCHDA